MTNRTKFTNRARKTFLEVLEATCNVSEAARSTTLSRRRWYELRDEHPDFAAEWDNAEAIAVDALTREARRRGQEGWNEPVFYKGDVVGSIRKYSDRMLELLLKRHDPAFRESTKTEITGAFGGAVKVEVRTIADVLGGEHDE